jgi:transcription elongation GreA/GreB family factor
MSRAFVKEPDGDAEPPDPPERVHSPHPNYVTAAGLRQLHARLAELLAERAPLAGCGDPEDRRRLRRVDRDLRYVEERIRRAILVSPGDRPEGEVGFGSVVEAETPEGRRMTFAIVGEDEADVSQGRISWVSPLAAALMEARVGDTVAWRRPTGETELTIVSIRNGV